MSDLISRRAAIEAFMKATADGDKFEWCEYVLKQLPSAQPERKTGQWIEQNNHDWEYSREYRCSECGKHRLVTIPKGWNWNYCPNCGAYMKDEVEE